MVLVNEILSQIVQVDRPMNWGGLATLKPYANFFVEDDVKALKQAMDAKGVDEATIVRILSNRSWDQRQLITKAFQKQYNADLEASLKKKLSGYLENVMVSLLQSPEDRDAQALKEAMKGLGTDEDTLIEILSTRSNKELQLIAAAYKREFQKTLEQDISSDTRGKFQTLLLTLLEGKREENSNVINYELIEEDARALHAVASQKKPNFDAWIPILTQRSHSHLNRVFKHYKVYNSQDITETIKKQMKGDDEKGFLALVQSIQNTPEYLADRLQQCMKSLGTKDGPLTRLLVSRCENDLLSIRAEFRKKYGKSLYTAIREDTKGDYQTALLGLCRGEDL
ncbi:annexin A2-like [Pristis pectinata]|uniref:annexin A2-like n=1 Tax=Pristis pectinata TaxID=685728 RepID=UPI00223DB2A0|nr:annexin A2-like [Pristis pectinata]